MQKKWLLGAMAAFAAVSMLAMTGCGDDKIDSSGISNTIAKKIGGSSTVKLPPNTKLVNVSWKTDPKSNKSSLYFLYRPMRKDEFPETYRYQEESTWGVLESTIIIKESRSDKN